LLAARFLPAQPPTPASPAAEDISIAEQAIQEDAERQP
jgi:hypothetical protein